MSFRFANAIMRDLTQERASGVGVLPTEETPAA
jgi:hypothetical protein